jgi:hypothetical protein
MGTSSISRNVDILSRCVDLAQGWRRDEIAQQSITFLVRTEEIDIGRFAVLAELECDGGAAAEVTLCPRQQIAIQGVEELCDFLMMRPLKHAGHHVHTCSPAAVRGCAR